MSKRKVGVLTLIVVIIIGICIGVNCWKNRKIEFVDENMAKVICSSLYAYGYGREVSPEEITWEQLDSIEKLNIGYSGYYNTIVDIEKCRNIETLEININITKYDYAYQIAQGKIEENLSTEETGKLQEELSEVLPKLSKMKELWLADMGECEWTSVEFLKNCSQLEELRLYSCVTHDYSALKSCQSLKVVSLWDCNISSADDIIGLEDIEYITLRNTPLGDKPEEIKKLQEAYPDAVVDVANYEEEE